MYEKVLMSQCWEEMGENSVKARCVDTNKGTSVCPNIKSRWVAKGVQHWTGTRPVQRNIASRGSEARHLRSSVQEKEGDSALAESVLLHR